MRLRLPIFILLVSFFGWTSKGLLCSEKQVSVRSVRTPAGESHAGYTDDVRLEKGQRFYEIYLSPPSTSEKRDLRGYIFNAQLTQEFHSRYREKFGYVDKDSLNMPTTQFTQFDENRGRVAKIESDNQDRRSFGEYMTRRLAEWHVDNYFKSSPSMREVYEMKEKMSSVQVQVNQETKVDVHYSLADNSAEVLFKNPFCDSKIRMEMDKQETWIYVGRQIHRDHYLRGMVVERDGLAKIELWNHLFFGMPTSLAIGAPFKGEGYTPRESSISGAFQHSF